MAKGMGFKAAAASVEKKEGVSKKSADKIIGYGKAHASEKARKANPNLNKKGGR
jgi:hypothetical protein